MWPVQLNFRKINIVFRKVNRYTYAITGLNLDAHIRCVRNVLRTNSSIRTKIKVYEEAQGGQTTIKYILIFSVQYVN